jgi:hypothetical protein
VEAAWAQVPETIPRKHSTNRIDLTLIAPLSTDIVELPWRPVAVDERTPDGWLDASIRPFARTRK